MEAGESPQEALKREIREELDAEIEVHELLETVEWDYPNFHLTMHCFICTLLSESLHLNEHGAVSGGHSGKERPKSLYLTTTVIGKLRVTLR